MQCIKSIYQLDDDDYYTVGALKRGDGPAPSDPPAKAVGHSLNCMDGLLIRVRVRVLHRASRALQSIPM